MERSDAAGLRTGGTHRKRQRAAALQMPANHAAALECSSPLELWDGAERRGRGPVHTRVNASALTKMFRSPNAAGLSTSRSIRIGWERAAKNGCSSVRLGLRHHAGG